MACEPRWTAGNHPAPEELLLAREDELPREEAEPILAHIHQCWQCRARVERYKRGIDAYVQFRKIHLDPAAAPRPGGWLRLAARLRVAESGQSAGAETFWKRVPRGVWLAFSAAAAVFMAALIVSPAPLTARVVLERAIRAEAAEDGRPSGRRVQIRRGGRVVAVDEDVLRAAHIDRSRPLSVNSFRTWHDALRSKIDSVTTAADEIRVETKTGEGPIALARLTVARADYRPHAKHVELRDGITIDVETVEGAPALAGTTPEVTARSSEGPAPAANSGANAEEREALEMEVRWALHRIDADLGEALEIEASGPKLVVGGTLDDPARRDQIVEALGGLPQVSIQLGIAAPDANALANAQPIEPGEPAAGPVASPLLAAQLLKDLPDPEARRSFVSAALDLSRNMLRHSWALWRLAQRYPSTAESALPAEVRVSLKRLVAAHEDAVRSTAREAASLWKPYVQLDTRAASSPITWQGLSLAALQSAQGFDHLTVRLLAAGGNDGLGEADALRRLRENQRQLLSGPTQENQ
jgi:hypothetical protein